MAAIPTKRSYDQLYLEDAMTCLAAFFEFGVCDYGAEGSEIAELFAMSPLAFSFEHGDPWIVAGKSGVELFYLLARSTGYADSPEVPPILREARTPEYWAGWSFAYAQWALCLSYTELFDVLPFDEAVEAYYPLHKANERRFALFIHERLAKRPLGPTHLATFRRAFGLTQQELAAQSGVSLRSIQMYEQRQKSINRAQAGNLQALARVLCCGMEDLMEMDLPKLAG